MSSLLYTLHYKAGSRQEKGREGRGSVPERRPPTGSRSTHCAVAPTVTLRTGSFLCLLWYGYAASNEICRGFKSLTLDKLSKWLKDVENDVRKPKLKHNANIQYVKASSTYCNHWRDSVSGFLLRSNFYYIREIVERLLSKCALVTWHYTLCKYRSSIVLP